jgi:hypothetical protein
MIPESEHQKNIERGLTFESEGKEEESKVEQEAEKPKRDMVRKRPVRTVRPDRSRKRT